MSNGQSNGFILGIVLLAILFLFTSIISGVVFSTYLLRNRDEAKIQNLKEKIVANNKLIEDLMESINDLEDELKNVDESLYNRLIKRINDLREEIEDLQEDNKDLEDDIDDLQDDIAKIYTIIPSSY